MRVSVCVLVTASHRNAPAAIIATLADANASLRRAVPLAFQLQLPLRQPDCSRQRHRFAPTTRLGCFGRITVLCSGRDYAGGLVPCTPFQISEDHAHLDVPRSFDAHILSSEPGTYGELVSNDRGLHHHLLHWKGATPEAIC